MNEPSDTHPEVARMILEGYRAMTPERRLELACEMSVALRTLTFAGLRSRFPDASELEIERMAAEIYLGPGLAAAVWAAREAVREADLSDRVLIPSPT